MSHASRHAGDQGQDNVTGLSAPLDPIHSSAARERASASTLHEIYLALLRPDGNRLERLDAVQAAAVQYEPGEPGRGAALEFEFSRLIGRPVRLSELQLQCFKTIFINAPTFAHVAPRAGGSTSF